MGKPDSFTSSSKPTKEQPHAENYSFPLVRQQRRRGREILYFHFQKFEASEESPAIQRAHRFRLEPHDRDVPDRGQEFVPLNGGPILKFTEAISLKRTE
jgi:hypothetical protein